VRFEPICLSPAALEALQSGIVFIASARQSLEQNLLMFAKLSCDSFIKLQLSLNRMSGPWHGASQVPRTSLRTEFNATEVAVDVVSAELLPHVAIAAESLLEQASEHTADGLELSAVKVQVFAASRHS